MSLDIKYHICRNLVVSGSAINKALFKLFFCWFAEFQNGVFVIFLDSKNFSITFMTQTFVWSIICLFTLLVLRKITPIPIVMEAWKGKKIWKCFLSVPVIHDPSSYPIHTSLLSADHPRIFRPMNNIQAITCQTNNVFTCRSIWSHIV